MLFQELQVKHCIKILIKTLNLSVNNLLVKNQNRSFFIHTKKVMRLINKGKRDRKRNELTRLLIQKNPVLNIQESFPLREKLSPKEKNFFFSFASASIFSNYISNQIELPSKLRDNSFKIGVQNGILSFIRHYFTRKNKFAVSGIKICCKGKWSKTATGRAQKLSVTLGRLNAQEIRSFVDYNMSTAVTKFGISSVKV